MLTRKLALMFALGYLASRIITRRARADSGAGRPVARNAGARKANHMDMVNERAEQSFPASDPPGTY